MAKVRPLKTRQQISRAETEVKGIGKVRATAHRGEGFSLQIDLGMASDEKAPVVDIARKKPSQK